jgi:hypothetical protein
VKRLFFLGVFFSFVALYFYGSMTWNFATGERAGWVQKFSKKGWICKTWEGEMAMVTMPGAVPEKFTFTVWDDDVAQQVNGHVGKRVSLHYEEKVGLPTSCFGETRHYVTRVTLVDDIPLVPGVIIHQGPGVAPVAPVVPAPSPAPSALPGAPTAPGESAPAPAAAPSVPAAPR